MSDFVGKHPVLAKFHVWITGHVAKFLHRGEHVDGQAFERAIHPGEAQHWVGTAGSFEEHGVFGVATDLAAHPITELDADLHVAGLVPALTSHI